ncbi:acyl carrier protein [Streptomyces sp. NPDC093544]|uniref:acyl carrier protein n=1 Tax=Streptomyces sp. NPDC093544 TaxID=3155200 RepID=UPI003445CC99
MQRIIDWIREKNPELDQELRPETDLIEARLISSLDFLEFIYLLEQVSGRAVDLDQVTADDFRTLDRIRSGFLTVPAGEPRPAEAAS